MKENRTYKLTLNYFKTGETEEMTVTTPDIDWTVDQIQRNRDPFDVEIREVKNG